MRSWKAAAAALALAALSFLPAEPASAQFANVVAACPPSRSPPYPVGTQGLLTVDVNGILCSAASVSASISGFRPTAYGAPITATVGGVTGTLPANAGEVVATNVGTTNAAYCALGASASTSSQYIAPSGGWFAFAISGDTQLTCVAAAGTTTINTAGGSGLPTGTGGGGGGGGGGSSSITSWGGGTLGAMANYGTSPGAVLVPGMNAFVTNTPAVTQSGGPWTSNVTQFGGSNVVAAAAGVPRVGVTDGSGNAVTSQTANSHTALDAIINDASGNRLSGLVTGTFGTPSTQVLSIQTNDPCSYAAKSSASIAITSATTTSLVAVSGSTTVYVCGFSVTISEVVTTANTIQFEYGTGAACTSPTVLTGAYGTGGTTAGPPILVAYGDGASTIFKSAASAGICALTAIGASGSFEGVMTYVQQ